MAIINLVWSCISDDENGGGHKLENNYKNIVYINKPGGVRVSNEKSDLLQYQRLIDVETNE